MEIISICIPTYNSSAYIRETIQSVLQQTYPFIECVVVDDCSADDTVDIVKSFQDSRIRLVVNEKNLGMTGNWNKCLHLAQGRYMKLLCADDLLHPDAIAREYAAIRKRAGVQMVVSDTSLIDLHNRKVGAYKRWPVFGQADGKKLAKVSIMLNNFFGAPCNVLFSRATALELGGFDPAFTYILDFDLWIGLACRGDVYVLHRELNDFRIRHDSNTGTMLGEKQEVYVAEHKKLVRKHQQLGILPLSDREVMISVFLRRVRNRLYRLYLQIFA